MWKIVREAPKPPSTYCTIDPVIEQVIIRAIQPDPGARQQNVGEMITALAKCLEGQFGTYGQDDMATFVTGLFGTSDTARHVKPRDDSSSVELSFSDLEESSLAIWSEMPSPSFSLPDVPAASFVEPHTSWSIARSPRPHTVVFSDPPLARASVPNLFVERPTMSGGHTNIFTRTIERPPALDEDPAPEWPWPRSRQKSQ
jgi:hypothetical protein